MRILPIWYYYNNPNGSGYTTFSDTIFGNVEGYLFLFFKSIDTDGYIRYICGQCYDGGRGVCKTFDSHQGPIFAVVIQNIAQINALNQTGAVDSDGVYLSNTITSVINSNSLLKNVIDDIRSRNNNDSTPIIDPSVTRLSPMSLLSSTPLNFYGMEDTVVNIKDGIIILQQYFIFFT